MYRILLTALLGVVMLLVTSGAALLLHERLEHGDSRTAEVLPSTAAGQVPIHRVPVVPDADCAICSQLLNFVALATIVLFFFLFAANAIRHLALRLAWPELVVARSPRSTRGPPCFA